MSSPSLNPAQMVLAAMGSLRLTVVLLGMSLFLVFAGTLAQVHVPLWTVIDGIFRGWWTWIDLEFFFPRGMDVQGGFPFPGGWLLGTALLTNLVVSHARRIKVKARGGRLGWGTLVLGSGMAATLWVISKVFDADSSEEKVAPFWRVTVQLMEGGGAAIWLFLGCYLLFAKKAGIVLLHGGIIMMMISELVTGLFAEESMMTIHEGESANHALVQRKMELAIIDSSDPKEDDVVVVPDVYLSRGGRIELPGLPFDVEVAKDRYLVNSEIRKIKGDYDNPATSGIGLTYFADKRPPVSGDDVRDLPAAYVTFIDRESGKPHGTWLVSLLLTLNEVDQRAKIGGKEYRIGLRMKRVYKDYSLYLYDFRFARYQGTDVPKDYSSFVRLDASDPKIERDVRIWMNNPLRYGGDTIYQADFDQETEKTTVLQVVENRGWMVPYVACMIVAMGLFGQFGIHLVGFARKRRSKR